MAESTGKTKVRILHAADLHLDTPGSRACAGLEALVDLTARSQSDLLLIAGDFFDHNSVDEELIRFAVDQLRRLTVPAVILPGNHDYLAPGCVFDRAEHWEKCGNVLIMRQPEGEILDLPEVGVRLWGKSHDESEDGFRPLGGMPSPQGNGRWHVALAHGYFVDTDPPLFQNYHISQEEVTGSGWDYIALGHVPVFRCVSEDPVKAYYSGSPSSVTGTVAIVDMDEDNGVRVTCYSMSDKPGETTLPPKF